MSTINNASGQGIQFYSTYENPFNKTYSEWSTEWWKWIGSFSSNEHPWRDTTGEKCTLHQNNKNVWFLADSDNSGSFVRNCSIPKDRAIWIAVSRSVSDGLDSEQEAGNEAKKHLEDLAEEQISLSIDGVPFDGKTLPYINEFKITSPMFQVTYAHDSPLNDNPTSEITYDYNTLSGYFVMLKPLSPGQHTIHIVRDAPGSIDNPIDSPPLHRDIMYNITVNP